MGKHENSLRSSRWAWSHSSRAPTAVLSVSAGQTRTGISATSSWAQWRSPAADPATDAVGSSIGFCLCKVLMNVPPQEPGTKGARRQLELAIVSVVAGSFLLAAGVAYVLAANQIGHWLVWERPGSISGQQWFEHIRNAATLVGVPAVGSALVFSYFRQKSTDRQIALTGHQLDLARDQAAQVVIKDERQYRHDLRDRFSAAMTALADADELKRTGGISTMVAVANDFQALKDDAGRQDCIDALVASVKKLAAELPDTAGARRVWKTIGNRMTPMNSDSTNWWDADIELTGVQMPLGPMFQWVLTGGQKVVNASAISSGSTAVVQKVDLDGGSLSILVDRGDMPLRLIQNQFQSGTLTIDFDALNETDFVSFEECVFQDIRLVISDRMTPSRRRGFKFFRCSFGGSSFILPDNMRGSSLEFSQCTFTDVPLLAPLPTDNQPMLDLWQQNKFSGKVDGYLENPEGATDFDRWSRKKSPYLRRADLPAQER